MPVGRYRNTKKNIIFKELLINVLWQYYWVVNIDFKK